jgi:hypothetical protein
MPVVSVALYCHPALHAVNHKVDSIPGHFVLGENAVPTECYSEEDI